MQTGLGFGIGIPFVPKPGQDVEVPPPPEGITWDDDVTWDEGITWDPGS